MSLNTSFFVSVFAVTAVTVMFGATIGKADVVFSIDSNFAGSLTTSDIASGQWSDAMTGASGTWSVEVSDLTGVFNSKFDGARISPDGNLEIVVRGANSNAISTFDYDFNFAVTSGQVEGVYMSNGYQAAAPGVHKTTSISFNSMGLLSDPVDQVDEAHGVMVSEVNIGNTISTSELPEWEVDFGALNSPLSGVYSAGGSGNGIGAEKVGFRITAVPEPNSSILMLALAGFCSLARPRRHLLRQS